MKNLILPLALFTIPFAIFAQTNPDLPSMQKIKRTPVDTTNKSTLYGELLWQLYFIADVDPALVKSNGYSIYDKELYDIARNDGKACVVVSLPGAWEHTYLYNGGRLELWLHPHGRDEKGDIKTVFVPDMQTDTLTERRAAELRYDFTVAEKDGKEALYGTPTDKNVALEPLEERPLLRYREYPLPDMTLHVPPFASVRLYRDRDPNKEPETMIVVSDK